MANKMTPKERVMAALEMKKLDRPPVICATQSVTVDVMDAAKIYWPEAHTDAQKMCDLSCAIPQVLGFESVRLPYCLTVEAEIMGCTVDLGKQDRTPMLKKHAFEADSPISLPKDVIVGRAKTVVEAVKLCKKKVGDEYPIVVGTTGPVTIAGHLVGTENLLLWMITEPEAVKKFVDVSAKLERAYIKALCEAGADVIVMSDPSSSTDMLSGELFDEYSKPSIKEAFADKGKAKTVLHICGDTTILLDHMIATGADGLSIEEKVSPEKAVELVNGRAALVGNVGVVRPLLQGTPAECQAAAERCAKAGFNLVAPGCGLAARVPLANIQALVKGVKG
ncbi:MAG: Methylcobamide:CoM methyltransferase MtaA [Methanomassiliicoccales archaeon PtaU1.Bin124]|nr:MAG: Methylcobamide:CoM methyltransferase MtaA [Methanomassiliicoccales archaeon PtaU1.Bin124]